MVSVYGVVYHTYVYMPLVASCLVVPLHGLSHGGVEDEADVGDVDAHAHGDGGADQGDLPTLPGGQHGGALRGGLPRLLFVWSLVVEVWRQGLVGGWGVGCGMAWAKGDVHDRSRS